MEPNVKAIFIFLLLLFSFYSYAGNSIAYPKRAEGLRIGGEVEIFFDVNKEGRTCNVRFISASPKYVFENDIKKQLRLWRFPAGNPRDNVYLKLVFKPNIRK